MDSKYKFDPLGATSSSKRNSGAFNVIWRERSGGINLGVVRHVPETNQWSGIYAWRHISPKMNSKNAVADWMLDQYMTSLEEDTK